MCGSTVMVVPACAWPPNPVRDCVVAVSRISANGSCETPLEFPLPIVVDEDLPARRISRDWTLVARVLITMSAMRGLSRASVRRAAATGVSWPVFGSTVLTPKELKVSS